MKIIFAGSAEFAVPFLEVLLHQVIAVYTQPDRPAGRGLKLTASPVKEKALAYNLPIYQPASLDNKDSQQQLQQLNADVLITVAYGLWLPTAVLQLPRFGCINVHPSLLPRWRGASPIATAILAGDDETGVTIIQTNAKLDAGDILLQEKINITSQDTTATLSQKLITLGRDLLLQTLQKFEQHTTKAIAQDNALTTFAAKINKTQAQIDWNMGAIQIDRMVRAFNPWPVAYSSIPVSRKQTGVTLLNENRFSGLAPIDPSSLDFPQGATERATGMYKDIHENCERRRQYSGKPKCEGYTTLVIKIWQTAVVTGVERDEQVPSEKNCNNNNKTAIIPGTIIKADQEGIDVTTGCGVLRILRLQLPGKKILPTNTILHAYSDIFSLGNTFL